MNDTYGITPEALMRSLPEVLKQDEGMNALARGIAQALSDRVAEIDGLALYPRIDELPEELLDILAYDFNVAWWDRSLKLEDKRRMIQESWHVRRHLGTKYAVELAVSAAFGSGVVTEWFEYGGEPYHFRISFVELRKVWDNYDGFLSMLEAVKRKSAVLDSLTAMKTIEPKLYYGMALIEGRKTWFSMDEVELSQYNVLTDENGDALIEEDGMVVLDG